MARNSEFSFNQLIVLGLLKDHEMYGLEIVKAAAARTSSNQASIGTIYPLLKDLVKDGWLCSRKSTGSPRTYYRLTDQGREQLPLIAARWEGIHDSLDQLLRAVVIPVQEPPAERPSPNS